MDVRRSRKVLSFNRIFGFLVALAISSSSALSRSFFYKPTALALNGNVIEVNAAMLRWTHRSAACWSIKP